MPNRRSPKYHPRIHPRNAPVLARYPGEHSAVRVLQVQAEARDICVGKEIEWPQLGNRAIDQEWFSAIDLRKWSFSSFAYCFISFDFLNYGWLAGERSELQPFEFEFLHELPRLRGLLDECEAAAELEENSAVLPLIAKAREFFDAFEQSIVARLGAVNVEPDGRYIYSHWGAGRCERRPEADRDL
jgi:hypothetical protein